MCNHSFDSLPSPSSSPSSSSCSCNHYRSTGITSKPGLGSMAAANPLLFRRSTSGEKPRHFLDSCFLCKTPLRAGDDIYMYRGDAPFCSDECREEQIGVDEAEERGRKSRRASMKNSRQTEIDGKSREVPARAAAAVIACMTDR